MTQAQQENVDVRPEDIRAVAERLKELAESLPLGQRAALMAALAIRIPPEVEGFAETKPELLVGDDVEGYFWWMWQQPQQPYKPWVPQPITFNPGNVIVNNGGTIVGNNGGKMW